MTLDCPIKNKEMRSHPEKSATLLELSLFNYMIMNKFFQLFQFPAKMIIQRNNKKTLQFLKQIECEKMILTTLVDEVTCFFWCCEDKEVEYCSFLLLLTMFFCFFLLLYLTDPSVMIVIDLRRLGKAMSTTILVK